MRTRWNSSILMLKSFLPYRIPLSNFVDLTPSLARWKITSGEWHTAEQVVPILDARTSPLVTMRYANAQALGVLAGNEPRLQG